MTLLSTENTTDYMNQPLSFQKLERFLQHWAGKSLDDIDLDKDIDPVAGRYKPFPCQVVGGNTCVVLLLVLNGKSENVNPLATKWTKVLNCKSFKKQY